MVARVVAELNLAPAADYAACVGQARVRADEVMDGARHCSVAEVYLAQIVTTLLESGEHVPDLSKS